MKTSKILCLLAIIAVFENKILAQENTGSEISIPRHCASIKLLGAPTWPLGISYNQMINPRTSLEIGVGLLSAGLGFEYYITNPLKRRLNGYTGLFASYNFQGEPMVYMPIGLSYFSKNDLKINLNAGVMYSTLGNLTALKSNIIPWGGISAGLMFGNKVQTKSKEPGTELKNIAGVRLGYVNQIIGVYAERLITPGIGVEVSIGLLGASVGPHFYLPKLREGHLSFMTGLETGYALVEFLSFDRIYYAPLGLRFLGKGGILLGLDLGPQYFDSNGLTFGFSLKSGLAF